MEILKNGENLPIENGLVLNTASIDNIKNTIWEKPVQDAVSLCKEKFGDSLSSIYIRGSVPKGKAIENISDIDLMVVLDMTIEDIRNFDRSWIEEENRKLIEKYPFVTDIEFSLYTLESIISRKNIDHIFIKTQSAHLFGQNIAEELPELKLGIDLVVHSRFIVREIDRLLETIESFNPETVKTKCTWIMKRILRTGQELVMKKSNTYTRDLYKCYENFSQYFPEKEEAMYKVLILAINPTDNIDEIKQILLDFKSFLDTEIKKEFDI